jgi:hypothetical protein
MSAGIACSGCSCDRNRMGRHGAGIESIDHVLTAWMSDDRYSKIRSGAVDSGGPDGQTAMTSDAIRCVPDTPP